MSNKINDNTLPAIPPNYKDDEQLFYLPPPTPYFEQEGIKEKMLRKTKENPFVPIGKENMMHIWY